VNAGPADVDLVVPDADRLVARPDGQVRTNRVRVDGVHRVGRLGGRAVRPARRDRGPQGGQQLLRLTHSHPAQGLPERAQGLPWGCREELAVQIPQLPTDCVATTPGRDRWQNAAG
jgi:hypothetical protein